MAINQKKPALHSLNRAELAELARAMMPQAMEKLERILHETSSDLAALQAFRAIKETAYGKDPLEMNVAMEFESLTDDELKAAIRAELNAQQAPLSDDVKRATQTKIKAQP